MCGEAVWVRPTVLPTLLPHYPHCVLPYWPTVSHCTSPRYCTTLQELALEIDVAEVDRVGRLESLDPQVDN